MVNRGELDNDRILWSDEATFKLNGSINHHNCVYCIVLYCSYLSSIHEKVNCISIFWTGRPHSLGSSHFRDVWATCLPHKGGGVPLIALPKDITNEVAGLFSTVLINAECQAGKL